MAYTTELGTPGKNRIVENDTSVGAGSGFREEVVVRGPAGAAGVSTTPTAAPSMATTQVTLVASTSTIILAARAARRFARVRVDSNAAVGVYVTEATPASAVNGLLIPPGGSEDIPYNGVLYAFSTGTPLLYIRDVYG